MKATPPRQSIEAYCTWSVHAPVLFILHATELKHVHKRSNSDFLVVQHGANTCEDADIKELLTMMTGSVRISGLTCPPFIRTHMVELACSQQ
jgi:hypothetical protein